MTTMYEEGSPNAPILFIGEAPSYVEEKRGQPLVGPAGEVFNDCLHQAGIIRHNSYILNVWEFQVVKDSFTGNMYRRLPYNQRGELLWTAGKKATFTEVGWELAQPCVSRILKSKANVIVPMGEVALKMCAPEKKISKWRGSIFPGGPVVGKRKVVPTYHPASSLHGSYTWRYIIMADFEKAKQEMYSPELKLPDRNLIIRPTYWQTIDYMKLCLEQSRICTDIEVINHQTNCFCLSYTPKEAMCIPVADEYGNAWWTIEQEMEIWKLYAQIMGDPSIDKINQNLIGFDIPFLLQQNNIFTKGFLGDTMIAQKIMYPEFRKGLDFICSIRTREPYYKDEGKMYKGMGGPIEDFWLYNAKDGVVALEAWNDLEDEMTTQGYWDTYNMVADLAEPIQYMTLRGMRVNHDELKTTHTRISQELETKLAELHKVAGIPLNPQSPKQCQQYFYGLKGIAPYKNGAGGITTDDKAMARIYRRYELAEAKLVQECRSLNKLKGTYLEVTFDKDGRLRCSWDPTGTWTGRLSSSGTVFDTGMNMQNLHPEFKHFLVADHD